MVLYKFFVDETRCMNCGICMDVCPFTALELTRPDDTSFYGLSFDSNGKEWMMEKPYLPVQERCTGCQVCVRECPTNAITVIPDSEKADRKPRPVILREEKVRKEGTWYPLSDLTRETLRRPVRSPWSALADWKPMIRERGVSETWREMKEQ